MINETNMKIPKKYHNAIRSLWHDSDGYWIMLNADWENGDGHQTIHEDTQAQLLKELRMVCRTGQQALILRTLPLLQHDKPKTVK